MKEERIHKKDSECEIPQHKISTKTKNKMGEYCPEGCTTGPMNTRWKLGIEKNGDTF
jgi:hypothetical protein